MTVAHPPLDPGALIAYRTLTLAENGRVLASAPLSARNDAEALSLVAAMVRGAGIDLWDGFRFIAHFGPEPVPTAIG
jgi:hypothetical protein